MFCCYKYHFIVLECFNLISSKSVLANHGNYLVTAYFFEELPLLCSNEKSTFFCCYIYLGATEVTKIASLLVYVHNFTICLNFYSRRYYIDFENYVYMYSIQIKI